MQNRVMSQDRMFDRQACGGFCEKDCPRLPATAGDIVADANVFDLRPSELVSASRCLLWSVVLCGEAPSHECGPKCVSFCAVSKLEAIFSLSVAVVGVLFPKWCLYLSANYGCQPYRACRGVAVETRRLRQSGMCASAEIPNCDRVRCGA